MPESLLILEAVPVPGQDGVLVIGKVKGDHYVFNPNMNNHAFHLNQLEAEQRAALFEKCRQFNAAFLGKVTGDFAIVTCGGVPEREVGHTLELLSGAARSRLKAKCSTVHPSMARFCPPRRRSFVRVQKSKVHGALVLNRRVDLHAIDATPARWRGGVVYYRSFQPTGTRLTG